MVDVHTTRLKEILAYLRQHPSEYRFDTEELSLENAEESLHKLGVFELASVGKNIGDFLNKNPPMLQIPNEARQEYDHYFTHDDFLRDIEDDLAIEVFFEENARAPTLQVAEPSDNFQDPYSEFGEWKPSSNEEQGNTQSVRNQPVIVEDNDGTFVQTNLLEAQRIRGMEVLAWYTPKGSTNGGKWGIYIRRAAPAEIAERFLRDLPDRFEAWNLALEIILYHEYFHFLSQYHCDRLSTEQPPDEKYFRYLRAWAADPSLALEEPVANAFAIVKSRPSKAQKRAIGDWFEYQPPPYDQYTRYLTPEQHAIGLATVAHMHQQYKIPIPFTPNIGLGTQFRQKPELAVHVYFVNDVGTDHPITRLIGFPFIRISKAVERGIRKGRIPQDIAAALVDFIQKVSGNSYERFTEHGFVRAKDKKHWRFELPRKYRGLLTQVKDTDGWCVVFVGSHAQYDAYCKAKGVRHK